MSRPERRRFQSSFWGVEGTNPNRLPSPRLCTFHHFHCFCLRSRPIVRSLPSLRAFPAASRAAPSSQAALCVLHRGLRAMLPARRALNPAQAFVNLAALRMARTPCVMDALGFPDLCLRRGEYRLQAPPLLPHSLARPRRPSCATAFPLPRGLSLPVAAQPPPSLLLAGVHLRRRRHLLQPRVPLRLAGAVIGDGCTLVPRAGTFPHSCRRFLPPAVAFGRDRLPEGGAVARGDARRW